MSEPLDAADVTTSTLNVRYRECRPTDIPVCAEIEAASYPSDEAASKSSLQYRQHHAARYFLCAVLRVVVGPDESDDCTTSDDHHDTVIGFVCSTKCHAFTHESMSVHEPTGSLLAIHSVVVAEPYRKQGIATRMLQAYIQRIATAVEPKERPEKIVLLSKAHLLAFYVKCGFQVMRPSAIEHGNEQWYDLELDVAKAASADHHTCFIVDAFADPSSAGTGNPAAVVPLSSEPSSADQVQWMQAVAQEFNLSETAFVWKKHTDIEDTANGKGGSEVHYGIRYFTPSVEVSLCGHATLASAAVLYQTVEIQATLVFHAPNDVLQATKSVTSSNGHRYTRIAMTFPTKPATELGSDEERTTVLTMLRSSLNINEADVLYMGLSEGLGDLLIELTHSSFLSISYDQQLNLNALLDWDGYSRGLIVCCEGAPPTTQQEGGEGKDLITAPSPVSIDFCSRFFGPKAGIPEDPVTGSAHCALAPHFCSKLGTQTVVGRQMSQRGGIVECELAEDSSSVKLTGSAVTTMTGALWI